MSLSIEDIFAAFDKPPEKAVEFLKAQGLAITWSAKDFAALEEQSFTIAKVMQLDILQDMYDEAQNALNNGITLHEFKKNAQERLTAKGWNGEREVTNPETGEVATVDLGSPWRLRVIFDTNLQTAYMAGRWLGMMETKETRPYGQIRSTIDNRTTKKCRDLHLKIFLLDDPIWSWISSPGHIGCRRRVVSVNDRYLERKGLTVEDSSNYSKEEYGNPKGFDKLPTEKYSPDLSKYNPAFVEQFKDAMKGYKK